MDSLTQFDLEADMALRYGPILGGADLLKCLGFKSQAAFKRAQRLGLLGVKVFQIDNRKGMFALTSDVAVWLKSLGE